MLVNYFKAECSTWVDFLCSLFFFCFYFTNIIFNEQPIKFWLCMKLWLPISLIFKKITETIEEKNWKFCFRHEYWIGQIHFRVSNCPATYFFLLKMYSYLFVSLSSLTLYLLNCIFLTTLISLIKSHNYSKLHNEILKDLFN